MYGPCLKLQEEIPGTVFLKNITSPSFLSIEKTFVVTVISKLKSVFRLKIFSNLAADCLLVS